MRKLLALVAVAVCLFAGTAQAGIKHYVPHKSFSTMTTSERADWLKRQLHHDQGAIVWLNHHLYASPHYTLFPRELLSISQLNRERWTIELRWYLTSRRIATRHLNALQPQLLVLSFPPHHALWECIAQFEATHVPVSALHPDGLDWSYGRGWHPAHGGGMGFSDNWGHGLVGSAGNYTQAQQEWAAESGFKESGYSYSFLYNQWYEWDNADGCGTTG